MLWDKPPHNPDKWVCDTPVGRYLIQRRKKGSQEFVLIFNGHNTKFYGTVEQLKRTVERVINAAVIGFEGVGCHWLSPLLKSRLKPLTRPPPARKL